MIVTKTDCDMPAVARIVPIGRRTAQRRLIFRRIGRFSNRGGSGEHRE